MEEADKIKEFLKKHRIFYGMVCPEEITHEKENKPNLIFHEKILDSNFVNFHPDDNTETLPLTQESLKIFLKSIKKDVIKYSG